MAFVPSLPPPLKSCCSLSGLLTGGTSSFYASQRVDKAQMSSARGGIWTPLLAETDGARDAVNSAGSRGRRRKRPPERQRGEESRKPARPPASARAHTRGRGGGWGGGQIWTQGHCEVPLPRLDCGTHVSPLSRMDFCQYLGCSSRQKWKDLHLQQHHWQPVCPLGSQTPDTASAPARIRSDAHHICSLPHLHILSTCSSPLTDRPPPLVDAGGDARPPCLSRALSIFMGLPGTFVRRLPH